MSTADFSSSLRSSTAGLIMKYDSLTDCHSCFKTASEF